MLRGEESRKGQGPTMVQGGYLASILVLSAILLMELAKKNSSTSVPKIRDACSIATRTRVCEGRVRETTPTPCILVIRKTAFAPWNCVGPGRRIRARLCPSRSAARIRRTGDPDIVPDGQQHRQHHCRGIREPNTAAANYCEMPGDSVPRFRKVAGFAVRAGKQ